MPHGHFAAGGAARPPRRRLPACRRCLPPPQRRAAPCSSPGPFAAYASCQWGQQQAGRLFAYDLAARAAAGGRGKTSAACHLVVRACCGRRPRLCHRCACMHVHARGDTLLSRHLPASPLPACLLPHLNMFAGLARRPAAGSRRPPHRHGVVHGPLPPQPAGAHAHQGPHLRRALVSDEGFA